MVRLVSEVIAIKLRRPENAHPYLGPQLFAGFSYLVASVIMMELWRVHRKNKLAEKELSPENRTV